MSTCNRLVQYLVFFNVVERYAFKLTAFARRPAEILEHMKNLWIL